MTKALKWFKTWQRYQHNKGKLLMKDGSYYEGDFENGEIMGNGILF